MFSNAGLQLNTAYRQRLRAMASVDEMLGDIGEHGSSMACDTNCL